MGKFSKVYWNQTPKEHRIEKLKKKTDYSRIKQRIDYGKFMDQRLSWWQHGESLQEKGIGLVIFSLWEHTWQMNQNDPVKSAHRNNLPRDL